MKYILIALFVLFNPIGAFAQRHYLLADVGTSPGFSLTYNNKRASWFHVGGGFQAYSFYLTHFPQRKFTPTLFADIRLNAWSKKRNQFFSFLDIGVNFYKQEDKSYYRDTINVYNISHNNGFYSGLGIGYFRRMTKRGGGPYVSVKMILNWYRVNRYSLIADERDARLLDASGNLPISLGFKF